MQDISKSFELLFDRPREPLVIPKGNNKVLFNVTKEYLGDEYKNICNELTNRFGATASQRIDLKKIVDPPKFEKAKKLPMVAPFSVFLAAHQEMAAEVIGVLLAVPENQLEDLLATCVFARANLNSELFNYCYSVTLMHRNDTKNFPIQNYTEIFPAKFVYSQVFSTARESAAIAASGGPRIPIVIPRDFTASDLDIEHRLAYFREDIAVNLHHWHWHLVYPFGGDRSIVAKDRRGELFYYMHQQIIARYNGERLANLLSRVKQFNDFTEPIPEAYYSKLDSLTTSRGWPPRQANMPWLDVNRPDDGAVVTIADMNRWRRNIEEAISMGEVTLPDKTIRPLDIDTLGNMIEASILSPNPELYGSLHNNGHNITAYMHDPAHRYLEYFSVMGDSATAMRDPFFYRWHAFIDDLFQRFKESSSVPPYSRSVLENPGVQITAVRVESGTGEVNTLNTFWMESEVDLSRGLDFSERGSVYVRFTHLNHRSFRYIIDVKNSGNARRATVRIFMSPKFDERNLPWHLSDQRKMFIEMDRFVVPLKPGQNKITRQSTDSSVTIPFEQSFRDLSAQQGDPTAPNLTGFNYCGCGWPQHLLVPRGTEAGMKYELFVMLSNYDLDSVNNPDGSKMTCSEASSFCGLKGQLYPDRRSMGFPFDRPSSYATNIKDLILPNMALVDLTIRLMNITEENPRNPAK